MFRVVPVKVANSIREFAIAAVAQILHHRVLARAVRLLRHHALVGDDRQALQTFGYRGAFASIGHARNLRAVEERARRGRRSRRARAHDGRLRAEWSRDQGRPRGAHRVDEWRARRGRAMTCPAGATSGQLDARCGRRRRPRRARARAETSHRRRDARRRRGRAR